MPHNPNFDQIGQAFVGHYYQKFDVQDAQARSVGLSDLYDADESFLTFEDAQVKGKDAILQKIASLPFKSIKRSLTKVSCQPVIDGSILVCVLGQLQTDEDPVKSYNQSFILRPTPNGASFFISNEIFVLNLHNM